MVSINYKMHSLCLIIQKYYLQLTVICGMYKFQECVPEEFVGCVGRIRKGDVLGHERSV